MAHGVGQRPERVAPGEDLADAGLDAAEGDRPRRLERLDEHAGEEVELDRQARAALEHRPPDEPREVVGAGDLEVAVDQEVLPRDQRVVEHQHRVVLVEAARERIVERAADRGGHELVGRPAQQLDVRVVHRREEGERVLLLLDRQVPVVGDEVVVRQRRAGGDHLGAADDDALVGLLDRVDEDVGDLVDLLVAVDRRVHERVVHEVHALLRLLVPAPRVVLERRVVVGVGPVGARKAAL